MGMLPETAQKRLMYVTADIGNVFAQQCLDGVHCVVSFTSAAAVQGLLHHQYGVP